MPDIFIEPSKSRRKHPRNEDTKETAATPVEAVPVTVAESDIVEPATVSSPNHPHRARPTRPVGRPAASVGAGETKHERHGMFPLAAFAMDPGGVYFSSQGENEEIHLFLRRHFITNIPWIFLSVPLVLLPLAFPLIADIFPIATLLSPATAFILISFYCVIVFGAFVLPNFMNWYFNVYIVTNERIVDVDFVNILYREVSATRLNLIQDVTVKTGGVIRAIFDYGDVFVQTAGNEANFDFHAVPHAQEVARAIEKLMEEARNKEGKSELEEAMER